MTERAALVAAFFVGGSEKRFRRKDFDIALHCSDLAQGSSNAACHDGINPKWGECSVAYVIKGTGDDACAELKSALDAQSAAFEAGLKAFFHPAPAVANVANAPAASPKGQTATAKPGPAAPMLSSGRRRFKY
jgi:hypothetical protein